MKKEKEVRPLAGADLASQNANSDFTLLDPPGTQHSEASRTVVTLAAEGPEPDLVQGARLMDRWFEGDDTGIVVLTRISSVGKHVVTNAPLPVEQAAQQLRDGIANLCSDDGGIWNVYFSCSRHTEDPTMSGRRRGGRAAIKFVEGVWADLDTKNEAFASGIAIDAFLETLPLRPTLVVDSGSGGRHVYWKFEAPVSRERGEHLNQGWWALTQEAAGGSVFIDQVHTSDRILRLPGTVRWPKSLEEAPTLVTLLVDDGPLVPADDLAKLVADPLERLTTRRRVVTRANEQQRQLANGALAELSKAVGWDRAAAIAALVEIFNENTSWDQLLIPFGWRCIGSDYEGRRLWARPGQRHKSATTDYPPSPNVLSLFSKAPETGLAHLHDAGIHLTKFQVWLELTHGGDAMAAVKVLAEEAGL